VCKGAAKRQQQLLKLQSRAVAQDVEADEAEQEEAQSSPFTMMDLQEFMHDEMFTAVIEKDFVEGAPADPEDPSRDSTLAAKQEAALEALFDAAAAEQGEDVDAFFEAMAEETDAAAVGDAEVTEEGVLAADTVIASDVLERLSNEEAIKARKVIGQLKLSQEEMAEGLLPQDWQNVKVDWFTDKKTDDLPLPGYKLNFLWLQKNLGVSVDQVYARGGSAPLTEYWFWPRKDAWDEVKTALEVRPWISEKDRVSILNRLTEVIIFWQSQEAPEGGVAVPPSIEEARAMFPDCSFSAAGGSGAKI